MRHGSRDLMELAALLAGAQFSDADIAICARAFEAYRARPSVTAVGIGFKTTRAGTDYDGALCIRVHVARKRRRASLGRGEEIPTRFEGLYMDVIEGDYVAQSGPRVTGAAVGLDEVIRPGSWINQDEKGPGTAGMFVRGVNAEAESIFLLSAYHVLSASSHATDTAEIRQGESSTGRVIGRLSTPSVTYDAALARLAPGIKWSNAIDDKVAVYGADYPEKGITLHMQGAQTKGTVARVTGVDSYEGLGPGMLLEPLNEGDVFCEGGDSGAIWFEDATRRAIGLNVLKSRDGAPRPYVVATSVVRICGELLVDPKLRDLP